MRRLRKGGLGRLGGVFMPLAHRALISTLSIPAYRKLIPELPTDPSGQGKVEVERPQYKMCAEPVGM